MEVGLEEADVGQDIPAELMRLGAHKEIEFLRSHGVVQAGSDG